MIGFVMIMDKIDRAYRETDYFVYGSRPVTLNINQACPGLADLHKAHQASCSAFITACNPFGQALEAVANTERQATLARELVQRKLVFIEGLGRHPSSQWPGEASFLVFGLTLEAARILGNQLEQNAIIWSGDDAVPRLVWLRWLRQGISCG